MLMLERKRRSGGGPFSVFKIRESWFTLFFDHGYSLVPSSSLVPENDDSLLFVNSGVSALKKFFRSSDLLPSRNLVNCQLSVRLSDADQLGS